MNNEFYSEEIKTPISVEFSIFTNKDVKKYSAVKNDPLGISVAESYDNYEPKKGGLVDLRLGTCDPYLPCSTCGLNSNECPGHFGHTELAEPVFHYGFLNHLKSVLQCICLRCSNILVDRTPELSAKLLLKQPKKRFAEMRGMCKNVNHCHHCGVPVPNIKKEVKEKTASVKILIERDSKNVNIDEKTGEKTEMNKKILEELTPRDCYNILRLVSNTDASLLGFNTKRGRPEDLIMVRFPVPPVTIRPTAKIDFQSSSTMENSLTLKIADIINNNNKVRKEIEKQNMEGDETNYKQDVATLVQYHVATFFDNESISLPRSEFKTGGKPTKSIKERLSGKQGRVRLNLMGKRVDFSGRTVITSDPYIDIDQLGVPLKIAMELTVPEEVTPYNIKYLSALVRNGRDKYPGANFVKRTILVDGKKIEQRIDLKFRKKDIRLQYGYVVERHMLNDDYVLFNRQPTLHRPSMMGHRVHILQRDDCNTFRMNVSVTKPYNADFDGDEMNIHLAQSIQARNELKMIANSKYQIILPKDSSPVIGCMQDTVSGAYMLSTFDTTFDAYTANLLLANTSFINKEKIDKNKIYTGAELFSKIIPDGINRVVKSGDKVVFEIRNGKIITGILDKKSLSNARNSIVHYIWDKYGANETQKFIDDSQRIILNYLMLQGQTVGFKDVVADKKLEKKFTTMIKQKILEVKSKITQYENDVDKISADIIEDDIQAELASFGPDIGSSLMKKLDNSNFFYVLINSGSKGGSKNIQQIMGCIGQINVEGTRVKKSVQGRSLSYFHKDDDTPEARGFVSNNYVKGLEAYEMFYQTIAGRAGLIDTAIKSVTWETPIIVIDNDKPKYIEIGKWIDQQLDSEENKDKVKHYEDRDMELLDTDNMFIPTTDDKGTVTWGSVSAVTRHDPGKQLYKIKTYGGREVIVTESKSLLVWDDSMNGFYEKLTPKIKVGDYLPVNENISNPPISIKHIKMENYLPKDEYVYGSEFNKAINLMEQTMEGRNKIPSGWWDEMNGNQFTLPYTKKASLQRCKTRSNTQVIKDNYIYPYHAKRNDHYIMDKFLLDYDNGMFIGLFLAEGYSDRYSVRITNCNTNIQNFVKTWFEKHNLKYDIEDKVNKIGGRSYTIRAFSGLLAEFLDKFVGSGAENKFVPNEAYLANEDFIRGLISGYISGDGCVSKNYIYVGSASKKLIDGISFLLNRLGIFSKMSLSQTKKNNLNTENIKPSYRLFISSKWGKLFSEKIELIDDKKNNKLKSCTWTESHRNFETVRNVVKDKIVDISLVDVKEHPKVYDLTIPSTLNFGLANGLQVRDTARTGYIQRKLIKALEDLRIQYDGTVRGSNNMVVQFCYGESGINQLTQTHLKINLINMSNQDIVDKLLLNKSELKKFKKDYSKVNKKLFEDLKEKRDMLRIASQRSTLEYKLFEDKYLLPVNLYRLAQEYSSKGGNSKIDLDPEYILQSFDDIMNDSKLAIFSSTNKITKVNELKHKELFHISLLNFLAPKIIIFEMKLNKKIFDEFIKEIRLLFLKSIVEPGEMVGILAAQSIGEPTTQFTLDTKHSAGAGSKTKITSGVQRVEELFHYSKKISTPIMNVYFKDSIKNDKEKINIIASQLNYLNLNKLIDFAEIYFDMFDDSEYSKLLNNDNVSNPFFINNVKASLKSMPFVFRLKINLEKILDSETNLLDIKTKFISFWYNKLSNVKAIKDKGFKELVKEVNKLGIYSNNLDIIHIRLSLNNFNTNIISRLLNFVLNNVTLKGVVNIKAVSVVETINSYIDKDTSIKREKEFKLVTSGISFSDILRLKGVDNVRTNCNDVHYIYKKYGVEAARHLLISELINTFNNKINYTHISLLADLMTHLGQIISIDRNGIPKLENEVMSKASFEMTMDHFINAALYNQTDSIRSVSSRIMMGKTIRGGTSAFDIQLDTNKLIRSEYTRDEKGGRIDIIPLMEDIILAEIMNNEVSLDFIIPN